jgi:hypothetical protein
MATIMPFRPKTIIINTSSSSHSSSNITNSNSSSSTTSCRRSNSPTMVNTNPKGQIPLDQKYPNEFFITTPVSVRLIVVSEVQQVDVDCLTLFPFSATFIDQQQDNQKNMPDSPMQANNSGYSNMNGNVHMTQERFNNLQAQLQQHLNNGGYLHHSQNGGGNISGTGMVGIGGNTVGNHNIVLSELPEPPISVTEIGPIPPPPMFSTPSPTMVSGRPHGPGVHDYDYESA